MKFKHLFAASLAVLATGISFGCSTGDGKSISFEHTAHVEEKLSSSNRNAVYLTHAYVSGTPGSTTYIANFLNNVSALKINYLFVNVGSFTQNGIMSDGTAISNAGYPNAFLNTLASTASSLGLTDITAIAWLNAPHANGTGATINSSTVRGNMVVECEKWLRYADENGSVGSYIGADSTVAPNDPNPTYGGKVRFHGCLWDVEYDGAYSSSTVANIISLLSLSHAAIVPYGWQSIFYGFKTTSGGLDNSTWWTQQNMLDAAYYSTGVASTGYDYAQVCAPYGVCSTSCTTAQNQYCAYMQNQAWYYGYAGDVYPGLQVWHGVPAFREQPPCGRTCTGAYNCASDPKVETTSRAVSCITTGLASLVSAGYSNPSTGVAMYQHLGDGTNSSYYSQYLSTSTYHDWPSYCSGWAGTNCDSVQ